MPKKQAADRALQEAIAADPKVQQAYGGAWTAIAKARANLPAYAVEHALIEGGSAFNSQLFSMARTLVRLAEEKAKPDTERLPEFTANVVRRSSAGSSRRRRSIPRPSRPSSRSRSRYSEKRWGRIPTSSGPSSGAGRREARARN